MMKLNLFFKLRYSVVEFLILSRVALLNARDGFVMRFIERFDFRPESCDLFIGLLEQKRVVSGFKRCADGKQYQGCHESPQPQISHGDTPNVLGEGPPERRSRGGNREAQLLGGPSRPEC